MVAGVALLFLVQLAWAVPPQLPVPKVHLQNGLHIVTWTESSVWVTHYDLERAGDIVFSGNVTTVALKTLHTLRVRAVSADGPGPWSEPYEPIQDGDSSGGAFQPTVLVLAIVCSAVFVVLLGFYFYPKRKRAQAVKLETVTRPMPKALQSFEVPRDQIVCHVKVGGGSFGDVFRGDLKRQKDGQNVTLAVAVARCTSEGLVESFLREAAAMTTFSNDSHPNVLRILAVCTQRTMPLVVSEFMQLKGMGVHH